MKKILIIEDDFEARENMAEILELAGYTVIQAGNGKEGVSLALREIPNLIVCDINMPELDGFGVLHMVQSKIATKTVPFIFLTGNAERSEMRKGMDLGADDYITKPCTTTELLNAVASRFNKSQMLRSELLQGITGFDKLVNAAVGSSVGSLTEDRTMQVFKKNQIIYSEGSHPHKMYYIQKGKVKTYVTSEEGKNLVLNIYSDGDFFGYLALLENNAHKESAETLDDCEIAMIPRVDFENLVNNDREISQKFIQLLAKNVREKEKQLLNLAYSSLRKRVAHTLLMLFNKYKTKASEKPIIDMSRENIANITGTTRESLIRTVSDFKEEGIIDIKGGIIYILKEKALLKLAN
jgi:CRP/FNR family cyclic AMP-dependent transcriptional regulator